jgi:hypothetical protein
VPLDPYVARSENIARTETGERPQYPVSALYGHLKGVRNDLHFATTLDVSPPYRDGNTLAPVRALAASQEVTV